MTIADHQRVVSEAGEATGRISGINHIVLITHDMEASVRFYRDLLGLKVVRTNNGRMLENGIAMTRQYFFELGNGELFSFYEVKDMAPPNESIIPGLWPEGVDMPLRAAAPATKLDHLAFDVPSYDDLLWFHAHLKRHGVAVSDIVERRRDHNVPSTNKFVTSIYFYDPSGNAVEIATLDRGSPEWEGYDYSDWFRDRDPVPSLRSGDTA
jgi:catechol 2,3-dioxygenase-like lactoylglutathione lyase family enzyme